MLREAEKTSKGSSKTPNQYFVQFRAYLDQSKRTLDGRKNNAKGHYSALDADSVALEEVSHPCA